MVTAIQVLLGLFASWFGFFFVKDFALAKKNNELESDTSFIKSALIGGFTNFFDTWGIGSFAPTTTLLRSFKQIHDRVLPGTLNVSCTIPVIVEAFIFIAVINVDMLTLIAMLVAAVVGAVFGAGIVSKWDEKKVQVIMSVALLVTAFLMLAKQVGWIDNLAMTQSQIDTLVQAGGTNPNYIFGTVQDGSDIINAVVGLRGIRLVLAVVINLILGALMTAGIGLYAPCMALVYMMGLSPKVAFPIMMGSCAFLMPPAGVKFVKEGAYNKKASMAITVGGVIGVFFAVKLIAYAKIDFLIWVVIAVVLYTAVTLFLASRKKVTA